MDEIQFPLECIDQQRSYFYLLHQGMKFNFLFKALHSSLMLNNTYSWKRAFCGGYYGETFCFLLSRFFLQTPFFISLICRICFTPFSLTWIFSTELSLRQQKCKKKKILKTSFLFMMFESLLFKCHFLCGKKARKELIFLLKSMNFQYFPWQLVLFFKFTVKTFLFQLTSHQRRMSIRNEPTSL